jgi:hypothetical protein
MSDIPSVFNAEAEAMRFELSQTNRLPDKFTHAVIVTHTKSATQATDHFQSPKVTEDQKRRKLHQE